LFKENLLKLREAMLDNAARALYQKGQYDRALSVGLKALEVAERARGSDHPDVANSLENLAALYRNHWPRG
jgi:tetratricopeptide (TPR) repeat protein